MDAAGLVIQLVSGAVGGNVAGALLKKFSLGTVGNSIVGILGGGLGGQLLGMLGVGGTGQGAEWTWVRFCPALLVVASVGGC